jgi:tRNA (guanosine-2'-O-)-methyltransferase
MRKMLAAAQSGSLLDPGRLIFGGRAIEPSRVVEVLDPFISESRRIRIERVLDGRTMTVAVVVDGIADTGNVGAVMRTAEGLGFLAFHVVAGGAPYKHSTRTSQGAEKWLDLHLWPTPHHGAAYLKGAGYRIVAAHLDGASVSIDEIDFTQPTAIVFGNERDGVSEDMLALSDAHCVIPMTGFAQSFNISVAAAVGLYHAYRDRLHRTGRHGDLTPEQRDVIRAVYYLRSVNRAREIVRRIV